MHVCYQSCLRGQWTVADSRQDSSVSPPRKVRIHSRGRACASANCSWVDYGPAVLRCLANMSSREPSGLRMYDGCDAWVELVSRRRDVDVRASKSV